MMFPGVQLGELRQAVRFAGLTVAGRSLLFSAAFELLRVHLGYDAEPCAEWKGGVVAGSRRAADVG